MDTFLKLCLIACILWLPSISLLSKAIDENSTYWLERELLLAKEQVAILGQEHTLTAKEKVMNDILMKYKNLEMNKGFSDLDFPPAKNFIVAKQQIEQSDVFQLIKKMPKGAALHLHDVAIASVRWVIEEITYWEHLYMCETPQGLLLMKFMETPDTTCDWTLLSDQRKAYPIPQEFDDYLESRLTLLTDNPLEKYPDINAVWRAFEGTLIAISGIVMYKDAWAKYLYRALTEFQQDNVLYVEFRGTLPRLYELDGTELTEAESLAIYESTSQQFLADHAGDYFGTKFIYAPLRRVDNETVWGYVKMAKELKKQFPNYLAGFDLVGQEDLGEPLKEFLDQLLYLSTGDVTVPVIYHAGETAWMGMSTDENLIDAILMNATRLGHGYAIVKHPEAKQLALNKDIPLEVCPISNQVLMLINDLRNHPIAGLISEGFPVVISADDPATWGASGLSYDFYEAFMGIAGLKSDLRFLKHVAINSIRYSSVDPTEKQILMEMWLKKWNQFIETGEEITNYLTRLENNNNGKLIVPTANASLNAILT